MTFDSFSVSIGGHSSEISVCVEHQFLFLDETKISILYSFCIMILFFSFYYHLRQMSGMFIGNQFTYVFFYIFMNEFL